MKIYHTEVMNSHEAPNVTRGLDCKSRLTFVLNVGPRTEEMTPENFFILVNDPDGERVYIDQEAISVAPKGRRVKVTLALRSDYVLKTGLYSGKVITRIPWQERQRWEDFSYYVYEPELQELYTDGQPEGV